MTQSGVSQHVRKLEAQLGQPLLERNSKQFLLTDGGRRLYSEGCEILRALVRLESQFETDPEFEGLVRIMSPGSIGLKLYNHLLTVQQRHPALVIDYRFAPNADIERAVLEHRIEVGLMTSPANAPELGSVPLSKEALLLVTPAAIDAPCWSRLMEIGFIDHPDGAYHASQLLGVNYPEFQNSQQLQVNGFSNQISLILEPVALGLGFTVLPEYAVEAFSKQEQVRTHYLPQPVEETIYLVERFDQPVPGRVRTVHKEVRRCLEA